MYCKKCGTYIDGESELCPACKAQEDFNFDNNTTVVDNTPTYTEQEKYNDRRAGLKGGIAGCINVSENSTLTSVPSSLQDMIDESVLKNKRPLSYSSPEKVATQQLVEFSLENHTVGNS